MRNMESIYVYNQRFREILVVYSYLNDKYRIFDPIYSDYQQNRIL